MVSGRAVCLLLCGRYESLLVYNFFAQKPNVPLVDSELCRLFLGNFGEMTQGRTYHKPT